ncbi:PAN domain-containing protein [Dendrobium catenatum]|uniref:PAN domain-containing protein n=1 Tax=Dendrobium catenatum TaxID=906689 RepID=A0A2I0X2M4_9ASPA|nr:PAN domain-containing protein [Dendrobium catenatum]
MEKKQSLCGFLSLLIIHLVIKTSAAGTPTLQQLNRGFRASFDQSAGSFQPLLSDPTGIFSFGFLQINSSNLDLAVIHLPSNQPVWRAIPGRPAQRSGSAFLSFNGSLLFSDQNSGVLWSTPATAGDRVVLLNSSNLQIIKAAGPIDVLWQSFDFPSDTIINNLTKLRSMGRQTFLNSSAVSKKKGWVEFGERLKGQVLIRNIVERKRQKVNCGEVSDEIEEGETGGQDKKKV